MPTEDIFTISDGASVTIDPSDGSIQLWTLGANRTPTLTSITAGKGILLGVDDGTAYTLTLSGVTWITGVVRPHIENNRLHLGFDLQHWRHALCRLDRGWRLMLWRDLLRECWRGVEYCQLFDCCKRRRDYIGIHHAIGAADGDILLAWVVARESGSSWTPGSGFTEQYDGKPRAVSVELASLELTAAPAGSYTFAAALARN